MKKISIILVLTGFSVLGIAQPASLFSSLESIDSSAMFYSQTIKAEDLKVHLSVLASDEYEGRETGNKGQKMAAEYIGGFFTEIGLAGLGEPQNRYQRFPLKLQSWKDVYVKNGDLTFEFLKDFYCYPNSNPDNLLISSDELVFIGYGIDDEKYSDYENIDVEGKVLLALQGEPFIDGKSIISGSEDKSVWSDEWQTKLIAAKKKGVKLLMQIDEYTEFRMNSTPFTDYLATPSMKLDKEEENSPQFVNNIYISHEMADLLIGENKKQLDKKKKKMLKKGIPASSSLQTDLEIAIQQENKRIEAENILGYIQGSEWPDEVIIVTAHYDHLGKKGEKIYNGADDDGSGTVALLEIAEAFITAYKDGAGPKRSILFMPVSGEEKGLLGSDYYSEYPLLPLENTVANLNIDMVGRIDKEHEDNEDYVYVIGSDFLSTELHQVSEAVAAKYSEVSLDYRYNSTDDPNRFYYRSDHYNFAKNNIPVVFYFNGTHDDYHQETDTVDKIRFDILEKRSKLIFLTAWELANRSKRVSVDID